VQEVRIPDSRMFIWPGVHVESGENIASSLRHPPRLPRHRQALHTDRPPRGHEPGAEPLRRLGRRRPGHEDRRQGRHPLQLQAKLDAVGKKGVTVVASAAPP